MQQVHTVFPMALNVFFPMCFELTTLTLVTYFFYANSVACTFMYF